MKLNEMALEQRDQMVAEVMAFLVERGYIITAPGTGILDHVDWEDLASQKLTLLTLINILENEKPIVARLEGLVNLLDHIQDDADKQGYPVEWLTEGDE